MLPFPQKIAFLLFAAVTLALGLWGFYRLYLRIRRGTADPELRFNHLPRRFVYALTTTLTQQRTFKKRPTIGLFHSFIFYGFVFYGLVNLVDAAEGYLSFLTINGLSSNRIGVLYAIITVVATYSFLADILSFLVLLGVVALVIRRFALPSRTDFRFNPRTLLHKDVKHQKITRDSLIVSSSTSAAEPSEPEQRSPLKVPTRSNPSPPSSPTSSPPPTPKPSASSATGEHSAAFWPSSPTFPTPNTSTSSWPRPSTSSLANLPLACSLP